MSTRLDRLLKSTDEKSMATQVMSTGQKVQLTVPTGRPTNVTEIVDYIIGLALKYRASDIHLGRSFNDVAGGPHLLRIRIDGQLRVIRADFIHAQYREIIARFKVLGEMNTTENQVPQDGQVTMATSSGDVVLRMSTVPSQDHEDIVIRIQRQDDGVPTLDKLLMTKGMLAKVHDLIRQKSGLIVLNGPAGSGKTTTIYAMINEIANAEKKIITAEDPIEKQLDFVSHVQVSQKASFSRLCRSFMRQDADVIFVGEVRDAESAEATVQLAQTGHLVLTTLHTRDAIGVISRLEAFDIHASFIANSLVASIAQRLVPLLCSSCRVPYEPKAKLVESAFGGDPPKGTKFYQAGSGCGNCSNGTVGRAPIFELFVPDAEICDLIARRENKVKILEVARQKGMSTLAEEALLRVHAGYMNLEDVYGYLRGAA